MKKIIHQFPFLSRVVLALLLGIAAIVLSGFIYRWIPIRQYFPFVGEALLVLVTWVLYRTDHQNLSAIGLNARLQHIGYLFLGLAIGVAAMGLATLLRTFYTGEVWHVSTGTDATALIKSLYYILPTVAVQELMFRGYLFTKTISVSNITKANIFFAILFMLVHVLDRDVMQHPGRIIMLAVTIPVGHLFFAAGLLRSGTLFFPIGLHWGNNWAVNHLTGSTDNSQVIFYTTQQQVYTTWLPFIILLFIFNGSFLLVTWAIWKWRKQVMVKNQANKLAD